MSVTPADRVVRPRRWPGVVAWTLWALAMVAWLVIPWLDQQLRQAGRPDLVQWDLRPGVALVTAASVGAVLASRRPTHPPVTPAARLARPRRWPGVVAWTLWALAMVAWLVIPWLDQQLRQAGRPDLASGTYAQGLPW